MPPTEGLTDGKAAIPLYQQVIDIIKNEINSGATRQVRGYPTNSNWLRAIKLAALPCDALLRSSSSRAI